MKDLADTVNDNAMKSIQVTLSIPTAASDADIKSLPRSSVFIGPDGYLMVKYFDTISFRLADLSGSPIKIRLNEE